MPDPYRFKKNTFFTIKVETTTVNVKLKMFKNLKPDLLKIIKENVYSYSLCHPDHYMLRIC